MPFDVSVFGCANTVCIAEGDKYSTIFASSNFLFGISEKAAWMYYFVISTLPANFRNALKPAKRKLHVGCCKDCGREIDWMQTEKGRYIPVDPEPVFVIEGGGDGRFYTAEEGVLTGRLARPEEIQTQEAKSNTPLGFVPHWWTCPCKGGFRRKRE